MSNRKNDIELKRGKKQDKNNKQDSNSNNDKQVDRPQFLKTTALPPTKAPRGLGSRTFPECRDWHLRHLPGSFRSPPSIFMTPTCR
jgi:hypothetical protein